MDRTNQVAYSIKKLMRGQDLDKKEAKTTLKKILKGNIDSQYTNFGGFLAAMNTKGPTLEEVNGLIEAAFSLDDFEPTREKIETEKPVYTICGSGKDDYKTFNVSTTASFIASACGVVITKNGSEATSQTTGASGVLAELGLNLSAGKQKMIESAENDDIAFFTIERQIEKFDSVYGGKFYFPHPLSYGFPALIIPIDVDGVIYGSTEKDTELAAKALKSHGFDNSIVVNNEITENKFIDELSVFGENRFTTIREESLETMKRSFERLRSEDYNYKEISSENREENARKLVSVLLGEEKGPMTDVACLNAGAILYAANKADSIEDGFFQAKEKVETGEPYEKLEALISNSGGDLTKLENHRKRIENVPRAKR